MSDWKSKKRRGRDDSYWQTIADALAALLLIVLLLLMILLLYIVRKPEEEPVPTESGGNAYHWVEHREDHSGGWGNGGAPTVPTHPSGGGGGGGDGRADEETIPTEPEEWLPEMEGTDRAAVYVMVVDGETDKTIKEAGIRFELYSDRNMLQVLSTYYPRKTAYRFFDTTENGVFYLPEKLIMGEYYLREVTVPAGYDRAENVEMDIREPYEWEDPYTVKVALLPAKNHIRIQMTDRDSNESVVGGVYEVIAAEDIFTKDRTRRYAKDTVVGEIICNEDGVGVSDDFYLGRYLLREKKIPAFYAGDPNDIAVDVEKRTAVEETLQILSEKTTLDVTVSDELYPTMSIGEAVFRLRRGKGAEETLHVDSLGKLTLTDLDKNTTYRLEQIASADGYQLPEAALEFVVDAQGRILGESQAELELQNRMIRVAVSLEDPLLHSVISDKNVAVYDSENHLIDVWDTTGVARTVEGVTPGTYTVCIDGHMENSRQIIVEDTADIQQFTITMWTTAGIAVSAGVVIAGCGCIWLVLRAIRKKRNDGKERNVNG